MALHSCSVSTDDPGRTIDDHFNGKFIPDDTAADVNVAIDGLQDN